MMEKADPAQKLYTRMRLWEFTDQYVLEPTDGSSASSLAISRLDGSMNLIDDVLQCTSHHVQKIWTIFGFVGMIKLLAGSYLLVITERECVGSYLGYHVFKIISMKVFPCDHSLKISPEAQKKMEIKFSRLLNVAERSPGLYFSYDVNITLRSIMNSTPWCIELIGKSLSSESPCYATSSNGSSSHYLDEMLDLSSSAFLMRQAAKEFLSLHCHNPINFVVLLGLFGGGASNTAKRPSLWPSFWYKCFGQRRWDHWLLRIRSAQRLHDLGDESKLLPLWRQADPQFLWNNYMLEVLIDNKLDPYLLPVMQGSLQSFQSAIGKDILDVTLIARRCIRRPGTQMWRRGADSAGFVANFVETEQMIQLNGCTASFIQVRGSIPLIWDQIVDLTYKPKFQIVKLEELPQVVERHFLDLRKKYGNVLAVDLANQHGDEGRLCEKFGDAMKYVASDDVRYRHFDFHRICGYVHFERLSILYHQIQNFLIKKNRYLLLNEKGEKVEGQVGVLRTNCIDCLDRTNVAQSIIARKMLESQLRRLGVFNAEETISRHPNFDESLKNLWANHGDDISIQYSGTPALKGDFVRYGQRTLQGVMKDGWNALMRYYLNNFCDGTKQDAIDLLQGHYIVSVSRSLTPRAKHGIVEAKASFPVAISLIMIGFFFATVSLIRARFDMSNILFSIMWGSMSLGIAAYVRANGRVFCNRPLLHQPRR